MNPWNVMSRARLDAEDMTEAVLDEAANVLNVMSVDAALAEVARLRALIAGQERGNHYNESNPSCPWCGISGEWEGFESMPAMRHADDCPAFSAPGVVR